MATITLAKFLQDRGLLKECRKELDLHCPYLLEVLGPDFLTKPEMESFGYSGPWNDEEYTTIRNFVGWDRVLWDNREERRQVDNSLYQETTDINNIACIRNHLANAERQLLGSVPTEDGKRWTTGHRKEVTPIPKGQVAPFASLLESKSLGLGPGGKAGGYRRSNGPPYYSLPVDGEERDFEVAKFQERLTQFVRDGNHGALKRDHCLFANNAFARFIPDRWGMSNEGNEGDEHHYGEAGDTLLHPRLRFAPHMPVNAIYVVKPTKMRVHAPDLCRIRTNDSGKKVIFMRTRIAQSLFHRITTRVEGSKDPGLQHFAYLAVRPPKKDD